MPRPASSVSTPASTGSAAGGCSGDSRYTPLSRVLSMSQTMHLMSASLVTTPLHRQVRGREAELAIQRPHADVRRVHLAGQLRHASLVGRGQHGREQLLADGAAVWHLRYRERPEVAVP